MEFEIRGRVDNPKNLDYLRDAIQVTQLTLQRGHDVEAALTGRSISLRNVDAIGARTSRHESPIILQRQVARNVQHVSVRAAGYVVIRRWFWRRREGDALLLHVLLHVNHTCKGTSCP